MKKRARSKSWIPMSRIMPPLLLRVGVLEGRAVRVARGRLEEHRRADLAVLHALLGGGVARVEAPHEAHLEEDARSSTACFISRVSARDRAGGFSQKMGLPRFAAAIDVAAWVLVGLTITTASTSCRRAAARGSANTAGTSNSAATSATAAAIGSATADEPRLGDAARRGRARRPGPAGRGRSGRRRVFLRPVTSVPPTAWPS